MRVIAHALIFLIAVAAGMVAGTPAMLERAGRRLDHAVERALDARVDYDAVVWDWDGRVTLRGLEVRPRGAPPAEAPLVTAREVQVATGLLWDRGRVRLRTIDVDDVRVALARRPDGSDNLRTALSGLKSLVGGRGAAADQAPGGGLGRYLDRHLPELRVTGLEVSLDAGAALVGPVPGRVHLRDGLLIATNPALLREDDRLEVEASFRETSLDPGHGIALSAVLRLDETGAPPIQVSFDRPVRFYVGQRVLAVGGAGWDGERLTVERAALSVPVPADAPPGQPVDPALTARRISVEADPGAIAEALRGVDVRADPAAAVRALADSLGPIEIERPTVLFERRAEGHSFADLLPPPAAERVAGGDAPAPDKSLGPLMEAARSAATRLTRPQVERDGRGFRAFLVRGFGRLEGDIDRLSGWVALAAARFPFQDLRVRGGVFAWRDLLSEHEDGAGLAGRLENFDLEARVDADVLAFTASFLAPGSERQTNRIDGKVHLGTGDLQLHAGIGRLRLHPYRHAFPASAPVAVETTLFDTDLTLIWSPGTRVARIEGQLGVADGRFRYPSLATETLTGIDLQLAFEAQLDPEAKTLVLGKSKLRFGNLRAVVRGDVAEYDTAPKLTGVFRLERARCQDVVDAVPAELVPMLEGLQVAGTIGWQLDFSLDTADMESLVYHSYPELNQFRVVDMGKRLNLDAVRGTFLHRIQEADGTVRELLVGPGSPTWASMSRISEHMVKAVTTTEDGSFFRHQGFSAFAIRQSLVTNLKKGGFYRGASTITQQLVKNLFLSREKTISRKLQELFITWQVESALDKERIMELYLNIIEFGPGIYGIRHAAWHFFGKRPDELSALEAVFLASLIPSPGRYYFQFQRGEVTDGWRRHLRWILGVMVDRGKITPEEFAAAAPYSPVFRGRGVPEEVDPAADPTPTGMP